jgi:hypothetical protein
VLDHLNDLLRLDRRQRPDLWIGRYTTPLAALTLTGTFPLSPQYEDIFVLAVVAYCELREEEYRRTGARPRSWSISRKSCWPDMQKYFNAITNAATGLPVPNASVQVLMLSTGLPAVIYADNGVTPRNNPVTTDAQGYFEFYAADGRYSLVVTGADSDGHHHRPDPGRPQQRRVYVRHDDRRDHQCLPNRWHDAFGGRTATLTVTGVGNFADIISTGAGVATGDAAIEVGARRTATGPRISICTAGWAPTSRRGSFDWEARMEPLR